MNTRTIEYKIIKNAMMASSVTAIPFCGNIANTAKQVFPHLKIKGIFVEIPGYDPWLDHVFMLKNNISFDGFGEFSSMKNLVESYNKKRENYGYTKFKKYKIVDAVLCEDYCVPYFARNTIDGHGVDAAIFDDLLNNMTLFKDIENEKRA